MSKDYYKILGVEKSATPEEIKKAFRRLAHEHHPDKGGDAQKFKDINEAYQILGDEQKRQTYDRFGSSAFEQGGMGGGTGGFGGFGFDPSGFTVNMEDLGDLGDVLGGMFGFSGGKRQKRGQDIQVDVTVELKEVIFGTKAKVKLYKHDVCSACAGSGGEKGSSLKSCSKCQGHGSVRRAQRTMFGTIERVETCAECQGSGRIPEKTCSECRGLGIERRNKELEFEVPAGISDGEAIKISGEGEFPGRGGRAGDLYLRIHVKPHPVFKREGQDIVSQIQIPYSTLVLGGSIDVETVDGPVSLKVPEATQAGTVFKLKGKGVPYLRSYGRGDHFVTILPTIPKKLTREQKEAMQNLRNLGL